MTLGKTASLSLSFLKYKIGLRIVLSAKDYCENYMKHCVNTVWHSHLNEFSFSLCYPLLLLLLSYHKSGISFIKALNK
jgi:hypothetical protein